MMEVLVVNSEDRHGRNLPGSTASPSAPKSKGSTCVAATASKAHRETVSRGTSPFNRSHPILETVTNVMGAVRGIVPTVDIVLCHARRALGRGGRAMSICCASSKRHGGRHGLWTRGLSGVYQRGGSIWVRSGTNATPAVSRCKLHQAGLPADHSRWPTSYPRTAFDSGVGGLRCGAEMYVRAGTSPRVLPLTGTRLTVPTAARRRAGREPRPPPATASSLDPVTCAGKRAAARAGPRAWDARRCSRGVTLSPRTTTQERSDGFPRLPLGTSGILLISIHLARMEWDRAATDGDVHRGVVASATPDSREASL
jgi:hypothetical protein